MSKWSIIGGLMCLGGILLYGFQMISSLMGKPGDYNHLCIYDLVDPSHMDWIGKITWFHLNHFLNYLASAPLYLLSLVTGAVILVLSGLLSRN